MRPRILLRTHYQADEPKIIIASVTECTSPTESRTEENIAAGLVRWARENAYTISIPGAIYAVGNARTLGFLNDSHRWTATGLAFGHIKTAFPWLAKNQRALSVLEERLYLKHYITNAGALPIKFGQWLLKCGRTTDDEIRKNSVIEKLLIEVLDEYLVLATDIRDRTAIRRERDRLSRSKYVSSTKRHKRYPLLTTLERLRLLTLQTADGEKTSITPDHHGRLAALVNALPEISVLERLVRENLLQNRLDIALKEWIRDDLPDKVRPGAVIADAYGYALKCGLQACSLEYLDDVFYALFPFKESEETKLNRIQAFIEPIHRTRPTEVRFHVDRQGRRAFVLMASDALNELASGEHANDHN